MGITSSPPPVLPRDPAARKAAIESLRKASKPIPQPPRPGFGGGLWLLLAEWLLTNS